MDSMENLDFSDKLKNFQVGEAVEALIVQISNDTVFIDVGAKSEGLIDKAEFTDKDGNVTVKEGDKVKAFYMPSQKRRDELRFTTKIGRSSDKAAESNPTKDMLESAFQSGLPVEGVVKATRKGGYDVDVSGVMTFCPLSQMGFKSNAEPESFIGQTLTFAVIEFKNGGKNIIVSNRKILEEEADKKLEEIEKEINVGDVVKVTVKSLQKFGAFVELENGFQVLLPISEISHQRVDDVSTVLTVGQTLEAKIISADFSDKKRVRVSVSTKELEKDPWDGIAAKYPEGTKLTGKIARIAAFGLFVNLEPGIDGLLHISALGLKPNTNLSKKFEIGSDIEVIVSSVDETAKKVSLTVEGSAAESASAEKAEKAPRDNPEGNAREYFAAHKNDDSGETYNPFAALLKK
ncbi:MAG: S1 RNA-binding domain-containing protein [Treponema sp.]|nr:S1 RNA-binding domain-containing protein [Treponema sp.]MBR4629036.1 S1 RNA-binding domain-containing protein [Treponema sp.]